MEMRYKHIGPMGFETSCKFVIDKHGLRVCEKVPTYEPDNYFIRNLISEAIDMDAWKHSWHLDVEKSVFRASSERKRVQEILDEKIQNRMDEIEHLRKVKQITRRSGY